LEGESDEPLRCTQHKLECPAPPGQQP